MTYKAVLYYLILLGWYNLFKCGIINLLCNLMFYHKNKWYTCKDYLIRLWVAIRLLHNTAMVISSHLTTNEVSIVPAIHVPAIVWLGWLVSLRYQVNLLITAIKCLCTLLYMIAFLIRFGMAVQVAVRFYIVLGWFYHNKWVVWGSVPSLQLY